jgi:vacuolar-type H+-ATPase subunit H
MERKEILEKLKNAEEEVRKNLETAQHKKNEILLTAQKQAQKLQDDGERRIKTEREQCLAEAKKDLQERRQQVLKDAYTEAEAMKKKARTVKAKELFIDKFKEYVHV